MAGNVITSTEALGGIPPGDYYNDGTDIWVQTSKGLERLTDVGNSSFTTPTLINPIIESSGTPQGLAASTDRIVDIDVTSDATSGVLTSVEINQEITEDGASVEATKSTLTSDNQLGDWANALMGKIDFSSTGEVTGLAGVICAELNLAPITPSGGHYSCFEAELNITDGAGLGNGTSFMIMNAWGDDVATFQASGYVFELTGLGTPDTSSIIQANTDQATHGLRILVDGTPYFLLMTTADNGTE